MKNYLIIGASSGIGEALSQELSASHQVFATYNTHLKTHERINYFHYNHQEGLDISSLPEQIHGLAYCPGSITLKPFGRVTTADLMESYNLNVLGAVQCIQAVLPKLKASGKASVVLFSTVAVQLGLPFHSVVSASKGAVEGLVKALAAELAPTIRVNGIAPSLTQTPLAASLVNTEEKIQANAKKHPLQRIGEAQDIARLAKFLLSEESDWITGQIMHVDGGFSTLKV